MPGLGEDIKSVFAELGTSYTIISSGVVTSPKGLKLDFDVNTTTVRPFVKEHVLEFSTAYDSPLKAGDVLRFTVDQRTFIVVHLEYDVFDNAPIAKSGMIYKTNISSGEILRPVNVVDAFYRPSVEWAPINTQVYALLDHKQFGSRMDDNEDIGSIDMRAMELYIPGVYDIRENDRFVARSGEYYRVTMVDRFSYNGVNLITLEEDTR